MISNVTGHRPIPQSIEYVSHCHNHVLVVAAPVLLDSIVLLETPRVIVALGKAIMLSSAKHPGRSIESQNILMMRLPILVLRIFISVNCVLFFVL